MEKLNYVTYPFFVNQRLEDVISRVERAKTDLDRGFYLLTNTSVPIPHETSWRLLGQFFVNALLFIGIIGTFQGLILAFADDNIINLLEAFQTKNDYKNELKEVFDGFHKAFASSLVAYISYLFGRVMIDIIDTDHDALGQFVEHRLMGDLAVVFSPLRLKERTIDIPEKTKELLIKNVEENQKISELQTELINKLAKLIPELTDSIEEWSKTSEIFKKATEDFIRQSNTISTSLNSAMSRLRDTLKELDTIAKKIVEDLSIKLDENFKNYTESAEKLNNEIIKHIEKFHETNKTVEDLARQIMAGRKELQDGILEILEIERNSRHLYTTEVNKIFKMHSETGKELHRVISKQSNRLEEIKAEIEKFEESVIGRYTHVDLTRAIKDLRKQLDGLPL